MLKQIFSCLLTMATLFPSIDISAQSVKLDSLQNKLSELMKNDRDRRAIRYLVCTEFLKSNIDSCLRQTNILFKESLQSGDSIHQALSRDIQARCYLKQSKLDSSIIKLKEAINLVPSTDTAGIRGNFYKALAERYSYTGEFDLSAEYMQKALQIFDRRKDLFQIAGAHFSQGNIWAAQNEFDEAVKKYRLALKINEQINNREGQANCLTNIGAILAQQEKIDSSLLMFEKATVIFKEVNNLTNLCIILSNMGTMYADAGQLEKSKEVTYEAIRISNQIGMSEGNYALLGNLSKMYLHSNNFVEAEKEARAAMKEAEKVNRLEGMIQIQELLYEISRKQKDYKEALSRYIKYTTLRDSLYKVENTEALMAADLKRDYRLQSLQDSLEFERKRELDAIRFESEIKSRRIGQYYLGFGLLLVISFGVILYRRYQETRRQKEIISQNAIKLQESEEARTRFFANISHEFRTPLSVISGMADLIKSNPERWTMEGTEVVKENSNSLLELVNQILDLQKLENNELKLNLIQANIVPFLVRSCQLFKPLALDKGLELFIEIQSHDDELLMDFDQDKLLRILSNLIGNAIKFTQQGYVKVVINFDSAELRLNVTDTGIGISDSDQKLIFNRFYQGEDDKSVSGQGTGIGLHYVWELVNLMHGNIKVFSQLNEGTTFSIVLPVTRNAAIIDDGEFEQVPVKKDITEDRIIYENSDSPSLLIIEDNKDLTKLLIGLLAADYNVHVAEDGQRGIYRALEIIPDIILTDLMMPVKDGLAVLDELKNNSLTSHIPIVMLTARADIESKLAGLRRGADDYISKPFNREELALRLKNALELRKKFRERYAVQHPFEPSDDEQLVLEDQFILRIKEVLNENLDNSEFAIPEFCKALGISRTQLHNKIKSLTGLSSSNYIRGLRLERAKEMLEKGELNISEVADASGFTSLAYFSTSFSKQYGVSPTLFLRK